MGATKRFGFIGGGNMAEAIIKGVLQSGLAKPEEITVFDPDSDRKNLLKEDYGLEPATDNASLVKDSETVVLAVKPQTMDSVLNEIGSLFTNKHLVVSVAAGVPITRIQSAIGASTPVVRVMPNTPALVLSGAAALAGGSFAQEEHMARAAAIFESVGQAVIVEEKYLDVVTGLSGSGPAYVFVFLEALADGAVRMGLPRKEAWLLACQTVLGSAKLARDSGMHPGQLKDQVTSPGGTTIAGLHALEKGGFRGVVMDAVAAATTKSKELGKK